MTLVILKKANFEDFYKKKAMSFAYIIAAIVIFHFVVGIGYLIYKINTAKPNEDLKKKENQI